MPTSDWGDWLPRAVERADPDGIAVWYLGCNGLVLKHGETTLFVDPYLGTGDPPRTVRMVPVPFDPEDVGEAEAEAVLATHEHTDHVHGPSQGPILAGADADYYAPEGSMAVVEREEWSDRWNLEDSQFTTVAQGEEFEVGEFTVSVEPARDPDADDPVSYVFRAAGRSVFHGGDARPSEAFERISQEYDLDLGVVAFGSAGRVPDKDTREPTHTKWYNDENEAIEAARQLQLDRLVPTHWDMWKGLTADPTALHHHARSFEYPRQVEVVEIGDRVDV